MRRSVVELTWLTRLLVDLSISPSLPISVHFNNQVAMHIAQNLVFHKRTKYLEIDYHFVRQQYFSGLISLSFVPSKDQLVDILIKPLSAPSHHHLLSLEDGSHSFHIHLEGGCWEYTVLQLKFVNGGKAIRKKEEEECFVKCWNKTHFKKYKVF